MDTKVTTDMHIEAPVEKVYAFAADMENWNQLKKSGMRGTIQTVEKTPDGVGTPTGRSGIWSEVCGTRSRAASPRLCRTSGSSRPPTGGS